MNVELLALQAFTGLSILTVLMVLALGLAIVFGLMGVINMAHGELMAMGAYTTYGTSLVFELYFPGYMGIYFIVGIFLAFCFTFIFGLLLERGLIQFLYKRPLDTLLATWGVGLILQQLYRQFINPRPVEVPTATWLQGQLHITDMVTLPYSRLFIVGLALFTALLVYLLLYKTRWGLLIRAVNQNREMSGAVGINQKRVDTFTFGLGCGLAGIAGSAFTMLASTAPDTGQAYIVDTFIVVVFGGVESLLGTIFSAFFIGQMQGVFEYYLSGSMARSLICLLYTSPSPRDQRGSG